MEFKDQIRIARAAVGMSQTELASKLGVSKQSIIWWESGEHRPKISRVREIEAILKVRLDLSERGGASPLDSESHSLAVDPETLRLAVAISRLPLEQREAMTTLIYIGEKAALGGDAHSLVNLEKKIAQGYKAHGFVTETKKLSKANGFVISEAKGEGGRNAAGQVFDQPRTGRKVSKSAA